MNTNGFKSATTAGLLGIFLGAVGAHCWYLGDKKKRHHSRHHLWRWHGSPHHRRSHPALNTIILDALSHTLVDLNLKLGWLARHRC